MAILYGTTGNDTIGFGSVGSDTMYGGPGLYPNPAFNTLGNDTYYVYSASDQVIEYYNQGYDSVNSSIGYTLSGNVERLTLTGTVYYGGGNSLNNSISGNNSANGLFGYDGNDDLYGYGGNDYLYGGDGNDTLVDGAGTDTMYGGTGNDTYLVDTTVDQVIEHASQGSDRVYSSVSNSLSVNVEDLTLTGTAYAGTGNNLNNVIYGNSFTNSLTGQGGNDNLSGFSGNDYLYGVDGNDTLDGGVGVDTMYGWTGNDTYYVDTVSDQVIEYSDQGYDRVYSSVSNSLSVNVESLTLTGSAYYGSGNNLNNVISGSDFANSLLGSGGSDTLYAYGGNDYLHGGEGNDFLYGYGGNDYLYGEGGNDYLFGDEGDDTLTGGVGTDTMYGGSGADRFDYNALSDSPGAEETSPVVIRDIIRDFHGGGDDLIDQIDLSTIDANLNVEGNQAFATNQLSYNDGILTANVIGFGIPGSLDLQIQLYDNPPLDIVGSTNDIIL